MLGQPEFKKTRHTERTQLLTMLTHVALGRDTVSDQTVVSILLCDI